MSVNFVGFDIATSGMAVSQKALEVAGHNISNLGTAGYSRQQAISGTAMERYSDGFYIGMGARIDEIRQIRDGFMDAVYRQETNSLGYWESRYNSVKDLETILGEPMADGLQSTLNEFWNSWQELSKSPESLTVRALVRQRADALVNHINHMGSQITKLQEDINQEIQVRIDEVNDITEQIADLNVKIAGAETAGNNANDYYDQRNYLVDRLSKLVEAETRITPDGQMDIIVGGYFLVDKGEQIELYAAKNKNGSDYYVPKIEGTNIEINVGQGALKGLLEARGAGSSEIGSTDNGTPNTTADINIVVDVSNTSAGYLDSIRENIKSYVDTLKDKGINYNLRLITYDDTVIDNQNYGTDLAALEAAIPTASSANTGNNFGDVVSALETNIPFRSDANKFALVFTNESVDGDELSTDPGGYAARLAKAGYVTSVVTDGAYHTADGVNEGWDTISKATGGHLYDVNSPDFEEMISQAGNDTNSDVNKVIATSEDEIDIISKIKKQLNALINITLREINSLHQSGMTLAGAEGGCFFEAIDDNYPMEMGNIKISDALKDLNNIVAASGDSNGDNTIALAIANIRNEDIIAGSDFISDIDSYYQSIILNVGSIGHEAKQIMINQQTLVEVADNKRQSVMGVSIDEEMTSLIKFKAAYNASSKAINVIDQMLDTMINRMGRVGL